MIDLENRTVPYNLEAEKAVLGAVLIDAHVLTKVTLVPDDFFRRGHQAIFASMVALDLAKATIDPLTLKDALAKTGALDEAGGPAYISQLVDGVPRSTNVAHYAAIVRETASLRRLIQMSSDLMQGAYDREPVEALVTKADKALLDLQRGAGESRLVDLRSSAASLYADIEYRTEHKGQLIGIDTGFKGLNDLTYGWQQGELVVIAARPSIGKTAFVLNTAAVAAADGKRVVIFSLEMRRRQLERRLLAHLAGVAMDRIQSGYFGEDDYPRMSAAMTVLHDLPMFVDDRAGQDVWEIRNACRRMKAEHGLDLVVIDYVQLMRGSLERRGATRNEEVTDISRRLKVLADEVSAPILLLSQLNRANQDRPDQRPRLSDLRESGALEQDADTVAFLHRKDHRESGVTKLILEKQRNGPTGTINLTINRDTQTFTDGGEDAPEPEKAEKKPRGPRRFAAN